MPASWPNRDRLKDLRLEAGGVSDSVFARGSGPRLS